LLNPAEQSVGQGVVVVMGQPLPSLMQQYFLFPSVQVASKVASPTLQSTEPIASVGNANNSTPTAVYIHCAGAMMPTIVL
jgi:hypothetical protein